MEGFWSNYVSSVQSIYSVLKWLAIRQRKDDVVIIYTQVPIMNKLVLPGYCDKPTCPKTGEICDFNSIKIESDYILNLKLNN